MRSPNNLTVITLLAVIAPSCLAAQDWGEIVARTDGDRWTVSLENSKIRVAYGRTDFGDIVEDQITELILKSAGENQAGKQFDEMGYGAREGRGLITYAAVTEENPNSKTVRIEWDKGKSIQDITIYKDSPILKMDYLKFGINLVDIASPGGGAGRYVIHASEKWKRGFVPYPKIYFDRFAKDVGYENITEVDRPGPLDYHGWLILGIYNEANGRGYGRVAPTAQIDIIKLLGNRGYELFTCYQREQTPFTGFVYLVTGGAGEILSVGRKIADAQLPEGPRVVEGRAARKKPDPMFRRVVVDGRTGQWYRDVKITADIDGDGYADLVAGHYPLDFKDPAPLTYYHYPDWNRAAIGTGHFTTDGQAADIDNDGDLDIITGDEMKRQALWYENPRPAGDPSRGPWRRHVIGQLEKHFTHDIEIGDVNRDGRADVLTRLKGYAAFVWLQRGPDRWTPVRIATAPDGQGSALADLDGDGDPDIALEGMWLENPAPRGDAERGEWPKHVFDPRWPDDVGVAVADLNSDGRPDVVLAPAESRGRLAWYEAPADPRRGKWIEHTIDADVSFVHTFKIADINLDGEPDVVFGEMHQSFSRRVGYFLNRGKGGAWDRVVISNNGAHNLRVADIGKDGDIDILAANWGGDNPLELYENQLRAPGALARNLPLDRWTYIQVDDSRAKFGDLEEPRWLRWFGLAARDVNRDGLRDIVSGRYFYLNPGGDMTAPWRRVDLGLNADGMVLLVTQKDGRMDLIAQRLPDLYWLRPPDFGIEPWTPARIGALPVHRHGNSQGYAAAQIEPSLREEVVFSSAEGLFYFRIPARPEDGTWPRVRITANASEEGFGMADLDGDTDLDAVAGSIDGKQIFWWENPGNGSADWNGHKIGDVAEWADRIGIADVNGDGRLDAVVSEETRMKGASVYWFEQPADPKAGRWIRHKLVTQHTTNSMDIADLDADGDPDIVTGEHRGAKRLSIWENVGGGARFVEHVVSSGLENHLGARVFDLDGDGDLDIVGIPWDTWQFLHVWRNDAVMGSAR